MILNIKNDEAHRLARQISKLTGETLTEVVIKSLRERLKRQASRAKEEDLAEQIMEIGRRCAALPELDSRTTEEIIGYDEHGIPR